MNSCFSNWKYHSDLGYAIFIFFSVAEKGNQWYQSTRPCKSEEVGANLIEELMNVSGGWEVGIRQRSLNSFGLMKVGEE